VGCLRTSGMYPGAQRRLRVWPLARSVARLSDPWQWSPGFKRHSVRVGGEGRSRAVGFAPTLTLDTLRVRRQKPGSGDPAMSQR
jgi:hypothetical protein